VKYAFIQEHEAAHSVRRLCSVMDVHPSGYYAWRVEPHSASQTATPIRDIEKAQPGTQTQPTRGGPKAAFRLEFVLRNGERAPATTEYFIASPGDSEKVLDALNQELGARSAMLS